MRGNYAEKVRFNQSFLQRIHGYCPCSLKPTTKGSYADSGEGFPLVHQSQATGLYLTIPPEGPTPEPGSRAGGAPTTPPPTPAPSQRATAWTPICRRSYFVIKRLDVSCVLRHASCQSTSARRAFSCSLQSATRVWVRAPGPHPPGSALVRATRESVRASLASLALHSPFGARSEGGTPSRNAEVRGLPRSRGSRGRRAVSLARLSQLPTPLARPPSPLPPQPCSRGESALPPRAPLAQPPDIT